MSMFAGDIELDNSTFLDVQFNYPTAGNLRAEANKENAIKDYSDWEILSIVAIVATPFIIGGWCLYSVGENIAVPTLESNHMFSDGLNNYGAIPSRDASRVANVHGNLWFQV